MTITIDVNELFTPATAADWLAQLLVAAKTLKLPTTAWQPGGITRTTLAIVANALQLEDVAASVMVQGGFLDFAASGSVTYTDVDGVEITVHVSPDPSDPAQNPNGDPTWLDVLASSVYNVTRILQTYAGGTLAIANTSAATYGPFDATMDLNPKQNPRLQRLKSNENHKSNL